MTAGRYRSVENFTLMTGLEETANNLFYRSVGMKELGENRLVGYIRRASRRARRFPAVSA